MGCGPSKDCCTDCKTKPKPSLRTPILQGRGYAAGMQLQALEQEAGGRDLLVWGPASVEAISEDAKLVRMTAIEKALPAAFRRGLISILHKDQVAGHYRPLQPLDASRVPLGRARALAEHLAKEYGGAPTGILEVTAPIAEAFPHLQPYLGTKQFFAGGVIYGDTDTGRFIQDEIRQGRLNAYSIAGMPTTTTTLTVCDDVACKSVEEVLGIDLSAITLGSTNGGEGPLSAKVRNPDAAFLLLQQAEYCEKCDALKSECICPKPTQQTGDLAVAPNAVASVEFTIKSRGYEFPTYESCLTWARGQGEIQDPAAFCGALEKETEEANIANRMRNESFITQATRDGAEDTMSKAPADQKQKSATLLAQAEPHLQKLPEADRKAVAKIFEQVDESTASDEYKTMLLELARRLDSIEQRLAAVPPASKEEAKDEGKNEDAVEQAATRAAEKALAGIKTLLAQAKPAETPAPAGGGPAGNDAAQRLLEAAQTGDPAALLEAYAASRKGVTA